MKIETTSGPAINQPPSATAAADRRAAAIAKLTGGDNQTQQTSVPNPSQVAPEDIRGALSTQSGENSTNEGISNDNTPKEATESSEPAEEPLSKQYAIIARKEKALRTKMQEVKAKELELATREQALKSQPQAKMDESKFISLDKLQQDPITTLLRAGISYDQITQMALNQPQMDPATKVMMEELKSEINRLKGAQEESKQTYQNQQTQAYKQAVAQIRSEATSLVSNDEAYEMIKATDSVSEVVQLIEDTFKADGILLSVEEAAREVEEYLVDQAAKIGKLKKMQQRLAPPNQEAPKSQAPAGQQTQMKTLTNSVGSTRQLSARERAMLAFKNELK